jgi:hypothetical protein
VVEELQEQLLDREEVLTSHMKAFVAWEKKVRVSERALIKVSQDLDVDWVKTKATHEEYLENMHAHTTRAKHTLGLDKMLGDKNVLLAEKERDLELQEATLAKS